MPDHLHLIIKMRDVDGRVSVAVVVRQLMKALAATISQGNAPNTIFEFEWHDWIVKKGGQLDAFRRYIAENPRRLALRRANKRFFTKAREITFHGARYWAYGNEALLDLPIIVAIKGHRSPPPYRVLQGGLRAAAHNQFNPYNKRSRLHHWKRLSLCRDSAKWRSECLQKGGVKISKKAELLLTDRVEIWYNIGGFQS